MDKDKLSDNWRFADGNNPLKNDTINSYIDTYGAERALGYIEAIADLRAEIKWILSDRRPGIGGCPRSASKITTMLKSLLCEKEELLIHAKNLSQLNFDNHLNDKLKQK